MSDISQSIIREIHELKSKGKVIGFTNGCFDLLHEGHQFFLNECKKNCDFLIVGLNSDTSVKQLKGSSRPIENQKKRMQQLYKLQSVNKVLIFNELSPDSLIKKICPNVLMKGKDYKIDEVIGKDYVIANGGRVLLISFLEGFSTTKKIKEINR